jgi:predicted double-glycine peptidase
MLALFGLGGLALWLTRASPAPTPPYEFSEVVTHSPEFLTREARKMEAGPRTILFLGDSLTASDYWKKISLPGATLRGKGWAGKQAKVVLDNSAPLLTEAAPTDVVFLAGVNNVASGQSAERVEKDLVTAWATFKARGARVWAVQLTPWYGYKFFNDAKKAPTLRAVTAAVNAFMVAKQGQPDGPDYVIDTSALGDADRKLLKQYSHDGLHMNGKGYTALAMVVQNALTTAPSVAVGADPIDSALQHVIDELSAKLAKNRLAPDAVELDWRTVTFAYKDLVTETIVKAGDLLPRYKEVGNKRYYFTSRTIGRDAAVGAEIPAFVQEVADKFAAILTRNDIAPAGVKYDYADRLHRITYLFHTGFRKQRADEVLPGGTKTGAQYVYIRNSVIDPEAEIGQVVGTAQSTPWTCGPAALRAVLAHHGDDVSEDRIAVMAGNVPVLGVRPDGLVKAAQELGYLVNATALRGVDALAAFLANDLPVLVVVDSFNHPGKAGHWVVVTALEGGNVRIMDPHTPGNWRVLPRAEFDARWWHREQGRVVRRFAIIIAPQEMVQG